MDLSRHNLIEASAGTGKTYTIEVLVHRLLTEEAIDLGRILVVTFTEKASGELKNRLRLRLEQELAKAPNATLRRCLDGFDQAPIFTIHGFCQRLLREFPLEQGQEFALDLVSRGELLQPALREVQRLWPAEFGAELTDILAEAWPEGNAAESWEDKLLEVAGRFHPQWGHRVLPEGDDVEPSTRLMARTLASLVRQVEAIQERRGQYTFDDLIERVAWAVDAARNPAADQLLARLRARYQCAVVDEFQDTDPLQWAILCRIFIDGKNSRLFLVGDPKQAIFAFRGADLPTYLIAREEIQNKHQGIITTLDTNYRSCPEVLTGLNRLFEGSGWFTRSGGETAGPTYQPVKPCEPPLSFIERDETGAAALNLVDLRDCPRLAADAHKAHSAFVAAEIKRLLADPQAFQFNSKEKSRRLAPRDIAVLVFARREARALTRALRKEGIPFSFYKDTGLWRSEEAVQVGFALEALARPEDRQLFRRLLLTDFFGVEARDLIDDDLPDHHPARLLFLEWVGYAESRSWACLFASLLEKSHVLENADDAERTLANLRLLLGTLEQAAYRDALDIHGLLSFCRRQRYAPDSEEGDYHPIETEESKVQILTIHAAKGLEYPIVFLAGGFTTRKKGHYAEYRHEGRYKVFHLAPDAAAWTVSSAEKHAEERRLLYVALTRAMFKLYLPMVLSEEELAPRNRRLPGPACLLLRPALDAATLTDLDEACVRILKPTPPAASDLPIPTLTETAPIVLPGRLFPRLDDNLARRRIFMDSFSSLNRKRQKQQELVFGDDQERFDDDDEPDSLEEPDPLRGAEFGDLVHRVLEKIDWSEVAGARSPEALWQEGQPARRLLDDEIRHTLPSLSTRLPPDRLEAACRAQVGKMVWLALKTPLPQLNRCLADVPEKDCLREMEFLFESGLSSADRFLTGFIDLIFRHEGRYYLLDWKTNLLESYDPEALEAAMRKADYTRQYRLYALALGRWLGRIHGDRYSPEAHLGGVFYLFLRGLDGTQTSPGIFFVRPKAEEMTVQVVLGAPRAYRSTEY